MKLLVTAGKTSLSTYLFIQDSSQTDGRGLAGLVFNTSGLTAYGLLAGAADAAITLATLAAASSAWATGGFKEVDATNMPGVYRFDIPNAYLTGAFSSVIFFRGAANMVPIVLEIEMTNLDLQDAVRAGLTALPNAAAAAAGGLFTRGTGAGQINQAANGQIDTNIVGWLGTAPATPTTAGVPITDVRGTLRTGTAQAGAAGSITLDAGAIATDNYYVPCQVSIIGGTGVNQGPRLGYAYVGSTKVLSVTPNWVVNPSTDSIFQLEDAAVSVEAWERAIPTALSSGSVVASANVATWLGSAPNALVSGRVDSSVGAMASAVITAAAHAANAITSTAIDATTTAAITAAVKAMVIETAGSYTLGQALSIILSLAAGVTSNSGNTLKTPDGTATRIAATVDASNDRTAMTLTPST